MNEGEEQDLRELLTSLEQADKLAKFASGLTTAAPLAGDDTLADPHRVSPGAWTAVVVAVDHLLALWATPVREESPEGTSAVIHSHAQASLVRGVIENAARAWWLLGPEDRMLRIRRRLALQIKEVKDSNTLHGRFKTVPARDQETRLAEVRSLALAAGAPAASIKAFLAAPQYTKIAEEAGEDYALGGELVLTFWSACSSLAQCDINGTLGLLRHEIVAEDGDVALARFTGNVSMLRRTTEAGIHLLDRALALYSQRGAAPGQASRSRAADQGLQPSPSGFAHQTAPSSAWSGSLDGGV
ncbi:hypothetical protein [Streptomyces goshikiensis]|uniref:hypothetical protein n=1 Tax=Streptomyces goshikiensis TaxID=1942 RepID=UPI0036667E60